MTTVIIGAGVIGTAIAYHLSLSQQEQDHKEIHLVDVSTQLFSSASGSSGAVVASDGMPTKELDQLGRYSWDLHCKLATEYDGRDRWGFCPMVPSRLKYDLSDRKANGSNLDEGSKPRWLADGLSTTPTSWGPRAIIDPKAFSEFLLESCIECGVQLHQPATPVAIKPGYREGAARYIQILKHGQLSLLPCDSLIISAGCWTPQIFSLLFPSSSLNPLPITSLSGHFLMLRSPCHSAEDEKSYGGQTHGMWPASRKDKKLNTGKSDISNVPFRIFSRVGGDIFLAGINNTKDPIPTTPEAAQVSKKSIDTLYSVAEALTGMSVKQQVSSHQTGEVVTVIREGVAYRPMTPSENPIVAELTNQELYGTSSHTIAKDNTRSFRVFVAAGHGTWGMSLSLGTGKVVSDLLNGKKPDIDVKAFRVMSVQGITNRL